MISTASSSLDTVAHIIQVALTPAFLLSGIASLLNVFANRLGRIADKVDRATEGMITADSQVTEMLGIQLQYLRRRSFVLDIAVISGACAGIATCVATLLLFLGALRDQAIASLLYITFAAGLFFSICALTAFLFEMLIASRGLRWISHQRDTTEDSTLVGGNYVPRTSKEPMATPPPSPAKN